MNKRFLKGKKVIALMLAVTMVVGEAGVVVAAPADEQAVEAVVEADLVSGNELTVQGASVEVPAETVTELTKPGKVTNLGFNREITDDDDNGTGVIDNSYLSWDKIQEADGYQVRVVDANGVEYASGTSTNSETGASELVYSNQTSSTLELDDLVYLSYEAYKYENEMWTYVTEEKDGETYFKYIEKGATYSVYIRAYNSGNVTVTNADGTTSTKSATVYGEWSDPVTYTIPDRTKLEKVADVRIVEDTTEGSSLWFTLGDNRYAQVEIKDAAGKEYFTDAYVEDGVMVGDYVTSGGYMDLDDTTAAYQYEVKEGSTYATLVEVKNEDGTTSYVSAFQPGQTYTLRVRGVVTVDGKNTYSDWSDPVTYTCAEMLAPEQPGQLEVDYSSKKVSWNSAKYADGYEVELKDSNGTWYNDYDYDLDVDKYILENITTTDTNLSLSGRYTYQLKEDASGYERVKDAEGNYVTSGADGTTYTVRVRAYNSKKDGERQYSEWSAALTCTLPEKEGFIAPAKVEGVRVTENGNVSWNKEKNADNGATYYEVEVKDATGREYYTGWQHVYDDKGKITSYKYLCAKTQNTSLTVYRTLYTYTMVDGRPQQVIHPETGYTVKSFEAGQTYTVRVRAYRNQTNDEGKAVPVYGDWSDAVTCAVPVSTASTGVNAKPAQVTGLWIQTEPKKDEVFYGPVMRWNSIENAERYEFEIKDSKGNLYASYDYVNGAYVTKYPSYYTYTYPEVWLGELSGYKSYSKPEGSAWVTLKNADGTDAMTFQAGETYTIRVRAINRYIEYDAAAQKNKAAVEYQGDWSEAVTYTPTKQASAVTGLAYVKADEDNYYFTYNADVVNSKVYYQIATDDKFNSASVVAGWYSCDGEDGYKLAISKTASYLKPSTTYYVRVVNSRYGDPDDFMEKSQYNEILATAAVTAFTTEAEEVKTPKNITGLTIYSESSSDYTLRFDAVLETGKDGYEIQVTSDQNSSNWSRIATNNTTISKSNLSAGTNYVRAVAYITKTDEITGETEKVYGTPSNVITITKSDDSITSAIGTLKLAEQYEDDYSIGYSTYTFTYTGDLRKNESVEIWYSDSKNFETNNNDVDTVYYSSSSNANKKITLNKYELEPGKTYYVKARTYNSKGKTTTEKYSAFSNVVTVKTTLPQVYVNTASVTKNSIKISMSQLYDSWWVKGYEIQRKSVKNKKTTWTTLNKSAASTYTDKKLKADTTYTYRVRPYYFDEDTNKTTNGAWTYYEAMTGWGGSLKLQAKAASKTSIKLTWSKISGAKGYEVYRRVTSSTNTQTSNGLGNGYTKYKQVANLSSKKNSYTDKKLTTGMTYSYIVKAYKTVGGKKVYIEESKSASLGFELNIIKTVQTSNGKVTLTWNPVYSAKGYLIEKYDPATSKWSTYKKITKAKTSSYTFPAAKDKEHGDYYRIRAYSGTKYTASYAFYVNPVLAAPTNVKASATSNGIKISWKAVSGADYYRVFRTTSAKTVYNKDKKTYSYTDGVEVGRYIADSSTVSGYRYRDLEEMNVTSVMDQAIVYSYDGVDNITVSSGPDTGVNYYYYVIAYKKRPQHEYVKDNDSASFYSSGNSKAASAAIKEAKPSKPAISKTSSKSKSVTLTFKAFKGADGYVIERSTKKKNGYTVIGTVNDPTKLTYKDKYNKKTNKLKKGKSYYYRVRAFKYNESGTKVYSSYSAVKKVKVK